MAIVQQVVKIRQQLPGVGTGKLHHLLTDFLAEQQIKLGRDKLMIGCGSIIYYALSSANGQKQLTRSILFTSMSTW